MTLQWTAVAIFLYIEIGTLMLLMLPWIRPPVWKKIFKSRIVRAFESYSYIYSYALGGILFLLFFDAIREVKKYGFTESLSDFQYQVAQVDAVVHMRLFRAQRNLYISGFALFLWLVIRRMVDLLSREANLMASAEASMRQAQSATVAAHSLMKEKGSTEKSESTEADEHDAGETELKRQIKALKQALEISEKDRDAMKEQADGVKAEYDRLMSEFTKLQRNEDAKKDS